jgi:DNA (cytosine-5)-methyltransferase 1
MSAPLITGPWNLTDLAAVPKNGHSVFSCFHCGGGSTMGYKLAGFDVLGGVEIDPQMMAVYRANHRPKHSFLMGVQQFNKLPREKIPAELFKLDILDGSPPCSSFSMAGSREKAWGEKKKFREGQAEQVLDDLFFHFIETARMLQPKVVIAENVKGLVIGKAKGYVKQIFQMFNLAGYDCQLFLLNAAAMGVPQRRERTFFIAKKKAFPEIKLNLKFSETPIPFRELKFGSSGSALSEAYETLWPKRRKTDSDFGDICTRERGKIANWNHKFLHADNVPLTIASSIRPVLFDEPRRANDTEIKRIQTFPEDYNFNGVDAGYVCGMSVPPFMMQRVANQVYEQWLKPRDNSSV